ncbi:Putative tyrosine-protein kinase Wsck [Harpegnathos saltator]|uniref:Putative tyrosine-protein kinase Wsck n=1 Tax=Harpegnathos saltator TaxID=610380 RepID=E2BB11_HARSA|nr:Putative tyrosine-protein kinase Wsck [Harpegnathos saltator]
MIASLFLFLSSYGVYFACGLKYEGCFRSSTSDPELPSPVLAYPTAPAIFAGLMNGQQCYCISRFGKNGLSNSCDTPCVNDPDNYCGSFEAMSVYSTGQQGPSPPRRIGVTREGIDALFVTWEPPDIPNGKVDSYTLRAVAVQTHATNVLPPVESQVQGGTSNGTTLRGLQPGTKYNISVIANNTHGLSDAAYTVVWTAIGPPDKPAVPEIVRHDDSTITVLLIQGHSEYGPISAYQVVVVLAGVIPPVGADIEYPSYNNALQQGSNYYVTAQFDPSDFHRYQRFTVGDGKHIGDYYNAPLKNHLLSTRVGLVVISRVQTEIQRSYSELTSNDASNDRDAATTSRMDSTALVLCIAITLLSILLFASILLYFVLRRRHERFHMRKLPEQQELTLQGPVYEVDNMGYIPDEIPERVNHYQELRKKVWSIPRNALTVDNFIIRRGRFGAVHTGTVFKDDDDSSRSVTVHVIADGALRGSEKRHMLRELDMCIRTGTMKYIAALIGTCETPDTLYVVHELPPQTLKNCLLGARSGSFFPVDQILPISASIAAALRYLASHKVVHTHLCARSIGLTSDWTPKLMGHGISKYGMEDIKYARWTAIECFDSQKKHQPGVVWAFGILLWEMFSMGGTPYSNFALDSEVEDALTRGIRLSQLSDIPDPIYEVMSSCWRNDPDERPTFDELTRLDTLSICPITAITEPYVPELELN